MDRNEKGNTNMVVIDTCFYNEKNNKFYEQKQRYLLNNRNIDEEWLELYLKPKKPFNELKKEIRNWLKLTS
jgi:hypothetical protein